MATKRKGATERKRPAQSELWARVRDVQVRGVGSRALAAAAKGNATLKIYDGLVHDRLHEPERDRVMADIEAFLDRVAN